MKQITKIIANGILAMDNTLELIAQAIEANSRLATFLCGDNPQPSDEQTEATAIKYCDENKYKLKNVREIYLADDFRWKARIAYTYIKYAKSPNERNQYNAKCAESDDFKFPVEFESDTIITL